MLRFRSSAKSQAAASEGGVGGQFRTAEGVLPAFFVEARQFLLPAGRNLSTNCRPDDDTDNGRAANRPALILLFL
jgi:hypothetical protein